MSGVLDSGRMCEHGNIDPNDPKRISPELFALANFVAQG